MHLHPVGHRRLSARQRATARAWKPIGLDRDEQFARKRLALLKRAAHAFNARGYHQTSLDEVAQVLGVSKPALYRYMKSKQEILFECHLLASDLADRALDHGERLPGTGFDKVIGLSRHYLELLTGELGASAVLTELDALDPVNRTIIAARRARMNRRFRRFLELGVADGSVRAVDPQVTTLFFLGSVNWLLRWFDPEGPLSGADIAEQFVGLLAEAIRAPRPSSLTSRRARSKGGR